MKTFWQRKRKQAFLIGKLTQISARLPRFYLVNTTLSPMEAGGRRYLRTGLLEWQEWNKWNGVSNIFWDS